MKLTALKQLKKWLDGTKGYILNKIVELSTATIEAIEEIENKKADKARYINITIPASGWQSDNHAYPKYYDIALEGITENDRADMIIQPESMQIAVNCGFFYMTETFAGKIRVRAMTVPTAAMYAEIGIGVVNIAGEIKKLYSANDIKSGILPIARGGTGNTTGNAATATKLQTARTLTLSNDVTGSATFDGSANKTITTALSNTGVVAGNYGALDLVTKNNGTVWVSNNVGLHGTSAISTWKAKQACKVSFRWKVSSESVNYDYLNITAAGVQVLANTGGATEQTGILTVALEANQTIVFTYRKDGSQNNGMDRAEISEMKYGAATAEPSTVIYESNVNSYFTITHSTYGFYPAIPIPSITVDAKGRITKAQTVYVAQMK